MNSAKWIAKPCSKTNWKAQAGNHKVHNKKAHKTASSLHCGSATRIGSLENFQETEKENFAYFYQKTGSYIHACNNNNNEVSVHKENSHDHRYKLNRIKMFPYRCNIIASPRQSHKIITAF